MAADKLKHRFLSRMVGFLRGRAADTRSAVRQRPGFLQSAPAWLATQELEDRTLLAAAFPEFIDPNPATGNQFGAQVVPLSTGNVVITSPYDDAGGTDAGAVYLFNGATGALISTLTGSTAFDQIGSNGIIALSNGNFVIASSSWDNGAAADAGAVTWASGTVGINGGINATNSLVGSSATNQVGIGGIAVLSNGNYVVKSYGWDNGAATDAGAATWGSGTTGVQGVVSATNSLVGSTENDQVGIQITALTNGNYVVQSEVWDNGTVTDAGAVTWGSGTSGIVGVVSPSNSLVGSTIGDTVGNGILIALNNGNYVVSSSEWDNGAIENVGAVTWGNGTVGIHGVVSAGNSLVGSTLNDRVGTSGLGILVPLNNGNYVVCSPQWDNGAVGNVGAVTWGNGTSGVQGLISASNSLIGSTTNDFVGSGGVKDLSNGNFVVRSLNWNNGAATNAGAVTWGNGTIGISGVVSASNSLIGTTTNDNIGNGSVWALSNGNYVVSSYNWDNGGITNAGAVTWGSGTTGVKGFVHSGNSLIGGSLNNEVGRGGVAALNNDNYVVSSYNWDNGATTNVGAVTWGSGSTGISDVVSASNSLIGSSANDLIGYGRSGSNGVVALSNGNFVVNSPEWRNGTATSAGAVTWGNGSSGIIGVVSASNSLVGTTAFDRVGVTTNNFGGISGVTALTNGNYVVSSYRWDNGAVVDAGASTFGSGTVGIQGVISAANSLVGTMASNEVSRGGVKALSGGNYVTSSFNWDNESIVNAGAVTWGSGNLGVVGSISATNSIMGEITNSELNSEIITDNFNGHFYARFLAEGSGAVRAGSQVDGFPTPLIINRLDGDNNVTISVVGSDLVITDSLAVFSVALGGGVLSNGNHTLTLPLSNVSGSITINGGGGDDTLTVDLSGGDPIGTGGLIFNGNDPAVGPGDTLKIVGGNQGTVTYNYTNAHDGSVVLSNFGTITYTGLEPIINSGTATDVIFNLPAGTNDVTLSDDGTIGNNLSRLLGLGFESTYFANPTGSVTISRGSADDKLVVQAIPDLTSSLLFGSNANPLDEIEFKGAVSLAATKSLTAHAQTITTQSPLTTSGGDLVLNATNGITLNDAVVTGGGLLTLNADSDANGSGSVSTASPVFGTWSMPAAESFLSSMSNTAGDTVGSSVAISKDGNTAIVGAYLDDVGLNADQGSAIVYIRSGGVWVEQAILTSLTGAADDRFGSAVALSSDGNTAVVGAYLDDVGANANEGSATVFVRVAGVWTEQALLTALDGAASDSFGVAVDLSNDGNTLVVGAYLDDVGSAGNAGSVTIFTRTGSTWTQQDKVWAGDGLVDDRLGFSVAVSGDGNTLIGGAYLDDVGAATRQGSAYVFTKSGVDWTEQEQLVASDGLAQDRFGTSVGLSDSGATAIVGSYLADVGANTDQGAAYTYSRTGTTWTQQAKLTAADGSATDHFGYGVSVSGDGNTALVGSRLDDVGANVDQGSATVFTRNGISWTQRNQLVATSGSAGDNFGIVAALDGDGSTAMLGAYFDDIGASIDQGSAGIFDRAVNTPGGSLHSGAGTTNLSGVSADIQGPITSTGGPITINTTNGITLRSDLESGGGNVTLNADFDANGTGTATLTTAAQGLFAQQQQIVDSTGGTGDSFGRSVVISSDGNTAIVGSHLDDVGANVDQGSAKVFVRSGDVWVEQQQLFATGGAAGDRFGFAVALSSDGNTALVSAYYDTVGSNVEQGSVLVFKRTAGVWSQQQQLTAIASAVSTAGAAGDRFGYSVALSSDGNTAIVGSHTDDVGSNSNQGSATIFTRSGNTWSTQKQITATGGAANDTFGISVALSSDGNTAIVGAYSDSVGSNSAQGSAFIFTRSGSTWTQQQQITAADGAASDRFGFSVALSADGNTAAVGAYQDDIGLNFNQGSVTFFTRSGTVWTQQQQVFANDGAGSDLFGYSVDLSSDGNTAIIGAALDDIGGNVDLGSATIYTRSRGVWSPQQQFTSTGGSVDDNFGIAVSISGDGLTLIVGAEVDDIGANADQGSSFIFTRTAGSITSNGGNVSVTAVDVKLEGNINAGTGNVSFIPVAPDATYPATHNYDLNGSFSDSLGGPSIVSGGGTLGASGYTFAAGQGPSLSNALINPAEYSILMRFSLSSLTAANGSPYIALFGFNDKVNDTLFHHNGSGLRLYPYGTSSGSNEFTANQMVDMVVTREEATNQFKVYIDGIIQYSVLDTGRIAVFTKANDLIRFFVDSGTLGEVQGGFLDRVRIYDDVLTATQVANIFNNVAPSGAVTLGAAGTGSFNLTDSELDRITAGTIEIGHANSGAITVSTAITLPAATNLVLQSPAGITINSGVNLNSAGGSITLLDSTMTVLGSVTGLIVVPTGSTLIGSGTTSSVTVQSGGTVAPGTSPGILNSGDVSFDSGSNLNIELNGTTVGTQYDQLNVTGTVTLNDGNLNLTLGYVPLDGATFTIINNDSTDAVAGLGTFKVGGISVPDGGAFVSGGTRFVIDYTAGSNNNDVVLTVVDYTTSVVLSSGNLVITDILGYNTNDTLTISRNGANVRVSDPNNLLLAGAAATQVDQNTVDVPFASITGAITIQGGGGVDTLTLDLTSGDPISSGGLFFNGDNPSVGPGDTLNIIGGSQGTVTYNYTNAHDGSVALSNYGAIFYTGLEPIINSGTATEVIFNLPVGTNDVTLSDDGTIGNNLSRLLGFGFETTVFSNPSASLKIRRGSANDRLFVDAIPDLTSSLLFGSTANVFAAIEFDGAVSLAANKSLTAHAQTITTQASLTTSAGEISLNATGDITITRPILSGGGVQSLTADSDGDGSGTLDLRFTPGELVDPNPAPGNQFGASTLVLSSGNIVVTSPYDDFSGTDAGAVYLFNGITGSLISTLRGSSANNNVGIGGLTALSNGNYVVSSPNWDNGAATNAGAVTWGSGISGISGVMSASNSLVGSTANDRVGGYGVTTLSNGNYVVRSPDWDNGAATDAGAVTWSSGTSGISGVVSASNSLVGSTANNQVGYGVTTLSNGNYVVRSPNWDNGAVTNAGAVTWGSGTSGISGVVSASNSLVGSTANNQVGIGGYGGVTALSNGNYVVSSPYWDNGAVTNAGAVTWGNGTSGISGVVSASNSLVGSIANDNVGSGVAGSGVTALSNGNYVVSSPYCDNGAETDAGAVTWGSGTSGISGVVSASNSLVGSTANDQVGIGGYGGVTALSNGNYVVSSPYCDNGADTDAGAVTWGSGTSGISGLVSASNSLVGSAANNYVGIGGVTALSNGNYVVSSPDWDNGATTNAGAVTWGSGASGISGVVSASNSLVGSAADNYVGTGGYGGVTALSNGNYVVSSPYWDNGAATDVGAVTWGNGTSGISGVVSASNSLVGSIANDNVGYGGVTALSNGNYVVSSPYCDNGADTDAGAVTWGNGTSGISGVVSASNSLVGSTANNRVGGSGVTALSNSNYVVSSPYCDNGSTTNAGAVTWGNGTSGISGVVSASNSLVGSTANDYVGIGGVTALSNGNYVVSSPYWDNGAVTDAGAVTWGSGTSGIVGIISGSSSIVGSVSNAGPGTQVTFDSNSDSLVVRLPNDTSGRVVVGSQAFGFVSADRLLDAGSGNIYLRAANLSLQSNVYSINTISIESQQASRPINLGIETAGSLSLTDTALDRISAGDIQIGSTTSGPITVSAAISLPVSTFLSLRSSAGITINSGANLNSAGGLIVPISSVMTVLGSATGPIDVQNGSTLKGTGTTSPITVQSGGTVAPGTSPGILNSGNVSFDSGSNFNIELNGTTVSTQYDQLNVTGTVTLNDGNLNLSLGYVPANGDSFTLINNDSTDTVLGVGTFKVGGISIPDGGSFVSGGTRFVIDYTGGSSNNDVVLTVMNYTTSVVLSSGNLVITDISGSNTNDTLTISLNGANVRVSDPSNLIFAGVGAMQVNTNTVDVPLFDINGSIYVNTFEGDDALTVDLSLGSFSNPIVYNGGTNSSGDSLYISGIPVSDVTHIATGGTAGSVDITGNASISYSELESITDGVVSSNRVFTFNGGTETITLSDAASASMTVDSTMSVAVTFANPTDTLTLNAGSGNDIVTLVSVDANYSTALTVNGDSGNDTVLLNADITFAPDDKLTVDLSDDASGGDIDQISVGANANLITSGIGAILLNASGNIVMNPGSSLVTQNGGITVSANRQVVPTLGSFHGIELSGATIATQGTGAISLEGRSGNTGYFNAGIRVTNGSVVESLFNDLAAGTITFNGLGATDASDPSRFDSGLHFSGPSTRVSSVNAAISMTGQGGNGESTAGVYMQSGASVESVGLTHGATITITGTGGNAGSNNDGVVLSGGPVPRIVSASGDVSIIGQAGANEGIGILLYGSVDVTSTDIATISLDGHGSGTTPGGSEGIYAYDAVIGGSEARGNININAQSDNGTQSIELNDFVSVRTAGNITIAADRMNIAATANVNSGSSSVTLKPTTLGASINLGAVDSSTQLGLMGAELDRITAGTLRIGDGNAGTITISAAIDTANTNRMHLMTGADVVVSSGVGITEGELGVTATGNIGFNYGTISDVDIWSATTSTGSIQFKDSDDVTVGSVDGVTGLMAPNGYIEIWTAGPTAIDQAIDADNGYVSINVLASDSLLSINAPVSATSSSPFISDRIAINASVTIPGHELLLIPEATSDGNDAVVIGAIGDSTPNTLELSSAELNLISAQSLRIGSGSYSTGPITILDAIAPSGITYLEVANQGAHAITFLSGASLTVPQSIGLYAGGSIVTDDVGVDIVTQSLVFSAGGNVGSISNPLRHSINTLWISSVSNSHIYLHETDSLSWNNSFGSSGSTAHLLGGTFALGGSHVIGDTNSLEVNGGTLAIGGHSDTMAGVTLTSGSITGTTGVLSSTSDFELQSGLVSAVLSGSVGLTKSTNGDVTLTNANTYSGNTLVSQGILRVSNTIGSATGAGSVTIASGAALAGAGAVSGPVIVQSGGTIAPGTSPGILNSGDVGFDNGSNFDVELNGINTGTQYDQLNVTGTVTLNDGNLNIALGYVPANGDSFTIINNDGADSVFGFGTFKVDGVTIPDGGTFEIAGISFVIDYTAGSNNNDVILTVLINSPPTELTLGPAEIIENVPGSSIVGVFNTTDPDIGDNFTYSFASGAGDTDNSDFTITGDQLTMNVSPDFETKSNYTVRIRTTDQGGFFFEQDFVIRITDLNENPTSLSIDTNSLPENVAGGTIVGALNTTDPDFGDHFTYSFTSGTGDTDNSDFTITGDQLTMNVSPDFETKSNYTVRIRTTDQGGFFFEQDFVIRVTDLNENPTSLSLDTNSLPENVAGGTIVGTLNTTDPDIGDNFTYSFATGAGDTDNAAFTITGDQLSINASPDFETKSHYTVRIRTTDQGGLSTESTVVVNVLDQLDTFYGTTGSNAFTLTATATGLTISVVTSKVTTSLGTLEAGDAAALDGLGGTDSVRFVGTSGDDRIEVTSDGFVMNGVRITLISMESVTLAAGAGNDTYAFDADISSGLIIVDELLGGIDTLDFSETDSAVSVNLSVGAVQTINSNLQLILRSASTFENVTGGAGGDTITGNTRANILRGGGGSDWLVGLTGNDTLEGGAGDDTLDGGIGNDTYLYIADTDLGSESLTDGVGTDTISFAGTVADVHFDLGLTSAQAVNSHLTLSLTSSADFDNLIGGDGNDLLTGNEKNNVLIGWAGDDTLAGASGNDTYLFDADTDLGSDLLSDAVGTETISFSGTASDVIFSLGLVTPQVVNSDLTLTLSSDVDFNHLTGGSGSDSLSGNAGNNSLQGGAGDDSLSGGTGSDTYVFDADLITGTDTIAEDIGGGTDTLSFSLTTTTQISVDLTTEFPQVVNSSHSLILLTPQAIENVAGGSFGDTITGNALNNSLSGAAGNDTILGGEGSDSLTGGPGDDHLNGGFGSDLYLFDTDVNAGTDTIDESAGGIDTLNFAATTTRGVTVSLSVSEIQEVNDHLMLILGSSATLEHIIGSALGDVLTGNELMNTLNGGSGDDVLFGGDGGDLLIGGAGNDQLQGGQGDDVFQFDTDLAVGLGADTVLDTDGVDVLDFTLTTTMGIAVNLAMTSSQAVNSNLTLTVDAGTELETVLGTRWNDVILGNDSANLLIGYAGNDRLEGRAGQDVLIGGGGSDTIDGGGGEDLLIAGTTVYDLQKDNVARITTEWNSVGDFESRIASLRVGSPEFPALIKTVTVRRDSLSNQLTGGADRDWFFANKVGSGLLDTVFDQNLLDDLLDEL